jgi:hypothetical protein
MTASVTQIKPHDVLKTIAKDHNDSDTGRQGKEQSKDI